MYIRKFVEELDEDTCTQIMKDMEQFEADGFIGNCTLRTVAGQVKDALGISSITLCMLIVVNEVHRRYAYKYLSGE